MLKQKVAKRLKCVSTTVMAASQPKDVKADSVDEAFRHILGDSETDAPPGDGEDTCGWLSVDRLSEEAVKERHRVLEHLRHCDPPTRVELEHPVQ